MITQQWMALGGGHPALAKTALLLSQSANPATQIGHYSAVIETESRLDMLAHEASVGGTGVYTGWPKKVSHYREPSLNRIKNRQPG